MDHALQQRFLRTPNAFQLLGVSADASEREVKAAYKELALLYHPDKNPDPEAARFFVSVKEAYHLLTEPELTEKYRAFLESRASAERTAEMERTQRQRLEAELTRREEEARVRKEAERERVWAARPSERKPQYEEDPELADRLKRHVSIDKAFYSLRFSWSHSGLLVDSEVMKALFEAFGEVDEVTVDQTGRWGQVQFVRLADCENAMAYFREQPCDFVVEFSVRHKRTTDLEQLRRARAGDLKVSSEALSTFLQKKSKGRDDR